MKKKVKYWEETSAPGPMYYENLGFNGTPRKSDRRAESEWRAKQRKLERARSRGGYPAMSAAEIEAKLGELFRVEAVRPLSDGQKRFKEVLLAKLTEYESAEVVEFFRSPPEL